MGYILGTGQCYLSVVESAACRVQIVFDAPIRLDQFVSKTRSTLDSNYALNFQYSVVLIGSVRTNVILPLTVCRRLRVLSICDGPVA